MFFQPFIAFVISFILSENILLDVPSMQYHTASRPVSPSMFSFEIWPFVNFLTWFIVFHCSKKLYSNPFVSIHLKGQVSDSYIAIFCVFPSPTPVTTFVPEIDFINVLLPAPETPITRTFIFLSSFIYNYLLQYSTCFFHEFIIICFYYIIYYKNIIKKLLSQQQFFKVL